MLGMTAPTYRPDPTDHTDRPAPVHSQLLQQSLFSQLTARAGWLLPGIPEPILRVLGTRTNSEGDRLDADVRASILTLNLIHPDDYSKQPVDKTREVVESSAYLGGGHVPSVGSVVEEHIRDVRVRHYRPTGAASPEVELPTLVYFHGGGWVVGSLDSHDSTCRWLCERARVAVLSVDYRLAPEHPFPAAPDDCCAVVEAAMLGEVKGVNKKRVAVGGDSAGGNLAAVVCLRRKREGMEQPRAQLLFVPVTDLSTLDTPSHREFAKGYFLTHAHMQWYRDQYLTDEAQRRDPDVSPLLADDVSGLAPAYVAVAGFDPLRDEGAAYAEKLRKAGVLVSFRRHPGLIHPFVNSTGVWRNAGRALDEAAGVLRAALEM